MKFGKWFGLVLVALGCGVAARAQLGIYGMYSGTKLTGIQCLSVTVACSNGTPGRASSGSAPSTGDVNPSGGFGGVYYDFRNYGPVRLGADFRAGVVRANKNAASSAGGTNVTTADSFLAGVRGSVKTPFSWLKPYAQVSVGYARSDAAELRSGTPAAPQVFDTFIQYEGFVGTDVRIFPFLDLRPIEVGIGNMNRVGDGTGSGSMGVRSLGAGLVFRIPTR